MALIDELVHLRDRALAALDASHDYYSHTKFAWRLVQQMVRDGQKASSRNEVTGTETTETQLAGLAQRYVTGYLASATFQDFVAIFERFVVEFLTAWLTEYPRSLSNKELKFLTVLDATDKKQIVAVVVEKEVRDRAYEKVGDWFKYIENVAKLGCPSAAQVAVLAEIKATRDMFVHNDGVANATYVRKSQGNARFAEGAIIELPESYHRESWQLIRQVVTEMSEAAIDKLKTRDKGRT